MDYADPIERLVTALKRLPGIGHKSAQRLAFAILHQSRDEALDLAGAIQEVKEKIRLCTNCFHITDVDPCRFCADEARDRTIVCVVEEPNNLLAIEKTREYKGVYHVLHGSLSPLRGIGPEALKIEGLVARVQAGGIREVILATNPTVEGEQTAVYLSRLLKPLGVTTSRIAIGVPVGSEIEYTDEVTMSKALEGRREI
ncbi:MAG TPA: recombination mediator RecR [Candidatus Polarisedimenticolia bacterium]|jgi:recombination protein RecR|nr:recombination mediator RecR [Candidatus Polarisedimenticolia bacterium]